jgi:hypothetical protein
VERVWLYLREHYLSQRVLEDDKAMLDAICRAWNKFPDETGGLTTLTAFLCVPRQGRSERVSRRTKSPQHHVCFRYLIQY